MFNLSQFPSQPYKQNRVRLPIYRTPYAKSPKILKNKQTNIPSLSAWELTREGVSGKTSLTDVIIPLTGVMISDAAFTLSTVPTASKKIS